MAKNLTKLQQEISINKLLDKFNQDHWAKFFKLDERLTSL